MNLLKPIVSEIQNILSKNSIDELIDIRISNLDNYDYQINNLVKYQNHPNIESIKDATFKLLDSSNLVDSFEYLLFLMFFQVHIYVFYQNVQASNH